ncbi:MAG: hypothetical protein JXO22_13700 [Phycisphaerae bacterium]|nr:hypothetical protein [Phycisphaerae bacterium]
MKPVKRWVGLALLIACAGVPVAYSNIDLEWRPGSTVTSIGDIAALGLYAVSDSDAGQLLSAIDLVFAWDAEYLDFVGVDDTGGPSLLASGFPASALNETYPDAPADGDGFYIAYASLGAPVAATPDGQLMTTFLFTAMKETPVTMVDMLSSLGGVTTVVYDGTVPNLHVTGTLDSAEVTILVPEPAGLWCIVALLLAGRRR